MPRTPDERTFVRSVLDHHRAIYKTIPGSEPEKEYVDRVLKEFRTAKRR